MKNIIVPGMTLDGPQKKLDSIDPLKTVHLCIDVQSYYLDSERTDRYSHIIVDQINAVSLKFRNAGLRTYWIYHTVVGDNGSLAGVCPREGDVLFGKRSWSAFKKTDLKQRLLESGIDTIILSGAYTSCCVTDTANDAIHEGFNTIVMSDCVFDHKSRDNKQSLQNIRDVFNNAAQTLGSGMHVVSSHHVLNVVKMPLKLKPALSAT